MATRTHFNGKSEAYNGWFILVGKNEEAELDKREGTTRGSFQQEITSLGVSNWILISNAYSARTLSLYDNGMGNVLVIIACHGLAVSFIYHITSVHNRATTTLETIFIYFLKYINCIYDIYYRRECHHRIT